jgi:hypothetical protein
MNKLYDPENNKFLLWSLIVGLLLILTKIFQTTILCFSFFGVIFFFLYQYLLIIPFILAITYLLKTFSKIKFLSLIPLSIAILTFYIVNVTDPVIADFYIYLPIRQNLIDQVLANQNNSKQDYQIHPLLGKVQVENNNKFTQITFPRYTIGMGDGGVDLIYRSDLLDISINPSDYAKLRKTLPEFPVLPFFKEVKRIKEHWFWQQEEW